MSHLAIVLIIISAITHAAWNFAGKRQRPSSALFLAATLIGGILLLPVLFHFHDRLALIPGDVFRMLIATGCFQALYFGMLAAAYRHGDMSLVYPLARSIPTLIVTALAFALGSGHQISGLCFIGILLVVAGCIVLPMHRFDDLRLRNYRSACCRFALIAAIGTAGYMVLDDAALSLLREAKGTPFSPVEAALLYAPLEIFATAFWLALYILIDRTERHCMKEIVVGGKAQAAMMGIGIYGAYTLVLLSMGFVKHVSYVIAFRQLSIPLGAVLGMVILNEPRYLPKRVGVGAVCAGVVLVGLG